MIVSDYLLFAVFALFFCLESILLSGKGTIIIYSHLLKNWDFTVSLTLPFFGGKHLSLKTLFPPLGAVFITGSYPVIMSPDGIMLNPYEGRYNSSGKNSYRFSDIKTIGISGAVLLINGESFCRMHSEFEAEDWKVIIHAAAKASIEKRIEYIDNINITMFDLSKAEAVLNKIFTAVRPLRIAVNLYYLILFITFPAMVLLFSLESAIIPLLIVIAVFHISGVYLFYKAFKQLFNKRGIPWAALISMAFFPPGIIRSIDYFFKDSMLTYNSATVSLALLPREKSEELISFLFREYTFFDFKTDDCFEKDLTDFYRRSMLQRIDVLINKEDLNRDKILLPPLQYGNIKLYCPRCHCQYTDDVSICEDCNIQLKKY